MAVYCQHCGESIPDSAQFCSLCGGRVAVAQPSPMGTPSPAPVTETVPATPHIPSQMSAEAVQTARGLGALSAIMAVATGFVVGYRLAIVQFGDYARTQLQVGSVALGLLQLFTGPGRRSEPEGLLAMLGGDWAGYYIVAGIVGGIFVICSLALDEHLKKLAR